MITVNLQLPDTNEEEQRHPFERLKDLVKDRKSIEKQTVLQRNSSASPDGIVGDDTVVEESVLAANKKE
ncbi:hypothetical protein EVAR_17362_1 [Eumeta japonica]|uniref:Uncharacterized protein n=1 Tax=Eumeta variegata TaxID=151549 RepID=A0A4C1WG23_EUMVA|nr:hypothetical protein EVAR_17362_1 [Eumeta japonica]